MYEQKGYSGEWIEKRIKGISIRNALINLWLHSGAQCTLDYAELTNHVMENAFGLKPKKHKQIKGLKKEILRDHMNDLELIITMLAETATIEITKIKNSKGMGQLRDASKIGGQIAGDTREAIENQTGISVISLQNSIKCIKKMG